MRSNPGDEFDDGDFDDYDEFEDFDVESALLTSELTDELVRHLAENWRAEEENKRINVNVSLNAALGKTPTKWIDAACRVNRVALKGAVRRDRRAKIIALVSALTNPDELAQCVREMPAHARAALRRVVENGGWLRLNELTRDFGGMEGDGWFWDEEPPTSSLGELRRRALLYVGKTSLNKEGRSGKRLFKVAVVPQDLRYLLRDILADAAIRREEESAVEARFATPEDLLADALDAARSHYAGLEWKPPIAQAEVESFLRRTSREGFNPVLIWLGVDILLTFIERNLHEIQSADDLCGYHVSELATTFVDHNYLQRWTLRERRNVIEIVRRLYGHLHASDRISDDTFDEIEQACKRLSSGARKLNLINRPPPLGGELIFTRLNPNTGDEERYTYNHQRLLMAWAGAFHQDWRTMLSVCETVPGGKQKAALIHELIALDPGVCDLIVSQADEDEFDRAILWFYEEKVLELSAW
jgi:hypothetical protein